MFFRKKKVLQQNEKVLQKGKKLGKKTRRSFAKKGN